MSVVSGMQVIMTSPVLSGNGITATLAEQEVHHTPGRILPHILMDIERQGGDIPYLNDVTALCLEVREVYRLELSQAGLFLTNRTGINDGLRRGILQLELSAVLFHIDNGAFGALYTITGSREDNAVLCRHPAFYGFRVLHLLKFHGIYIEAKEVAHSTFFAEHFDGK